VAAADAVWCRTSASTIHWRCIDGDWVIYEAGSGTTAQLDHWCAALLGLIEEHTRAESELLAILATELEQPVDDSLMNTMNAALRHLKSLGLIEPPLQ
jgi:hypothetical protein